MPSAAHRRPQVAVLGSAEPGSRAYELAGEAGTLLASLGITLVSGCGSPATRVAAQRAVDAGGQVLSIVPPGEMPPADWPATVVVPCGMGDARNLLMALAGDACLVIGGRAGTISEVCLAWLHKRPLLPLVGCGGWSDGLLQNPPDERRNAPILPWSSAAELQARLVELGLLAVPSSPVPFAVRRIDHLVFRVRDLARSAAFYRDVLGCEVVRRRDDLGLWHLRVGVSMVDLISVDGRLGRAGGAAAGADGRNVDHLCLRIEPFDEDVLRQHLQRHGVTPHGPAAINFGAEGEGLSLYFDDPDGNTVELKGPSQVDSTGHVASDGDLPQATG